MFKRLWPLVVGMLSVPSLAHGQVTDYTAGKSPPQLFASDCSACHSSSRGLSRGKDAGSLARFLREHYTTKQEAAALLAGFLASPGNAGPEPRTRQPGGATAGRRPPGVPPAPVGTEPAATPEEGPGRRPPRAIAVIPRDSVARPDPRSGAGAKDRAKPEPPAEAARAAEDAVKSKVRAYATTGEEARPIPPQPEAQTAPQQPPPQPAPQAATPPTGATITVSPAPAAPRTSPPEQRTPPAGAERPATSPPS